MHTYFCLGNHGRVHEEVAKETLTDDDPYFHVDYDLDILTFVQEVIFVYKVIENDEHKEAILNVDDPYFHVDYDHVDDHDDK